MGITCEEVWGDMSEYVDDELDLMQRTALEEHFAECRHCASVLEGTCNIIRLYRDERVLAPPKEFHDRLRRRLDQRLNQGSEDRIHPSRRTVLAWALTAEPYDARGEFYPPIPGSEDRIHPSRRTVLAWGEF